MQLFCEIVTGLILENKGMRALQLKKGKNDQ